MCGNFCKSTNPFVYIQDDEEKVESRRTSVAVDTEKTDSRRSSAASSVADKTDSRRSSVADKKVVRFNVKLIHYFLSTISIFVVVFVVDCKRLK